MHSTDLCDPLSFLEPAFSFYLVKHLGNDWMNCSSLCCLDNHGAQRMNPKAFGDPLNLHLTMPSVQNVSIYIDSV